jgi:hypothetical protein
MSHINEKTSIFLEIIKKKNLNLKKFNPNPFTGDFDLPKRICLNGLFWFSFDKIKIFNFGDVTKKSVFDLSDASKSVFEKCCSTSFSKEFE